jgi:hypothetical protein
MNTRLKIEIVDWQDRDFVLALEAGLASALREGLSADCLAVADRVQVDLRLAGFPDASIVYARSVDDVLARIAHWTVSREGHPSGTRA